MPIKIPDDLPANDILTQENIFVMNEKRALHQDIRALKIVILNLMPLKKITETQILRLLSNTPLQVDIIFLHSKTHKSKNTSKQHLTRFYATFDEIKKQKFDGLIITGAPVEHLHFDEVDYWNELKDIMEWSIHNVYSTFYICWAAQAGLYYHYGIPKYQLPEKMFGVFKHQTKKPKSKLLRGFDDKFWAPHSRHTEIKKIDIKQIEEIEILSESKKAGVYLLAEKNGRKIFVTGHSEYDRLTLKKEYKRDLACGKKISIPNNYFPDDDPKQEPINKWRGHAHLLFSNWLNYCVYQETPYYLNEIH